MINVLKSRCYLTKTLNIYIMKHSTKKYRTDNSFIIRNRHVNTIASLLKIHGKMRLQISNFTSQLLSEHLKCLLVVRLSNIVNVQKSFFQVTKMLKINIMKSSKKYRNDNSFIIRIRQVLLCHVCFNRHGKMRHCRFHSSHHGNILQNTELLYLLVMLGKMIDVPKSRFQVTKTLIINIMKHSTNK
jgi:hypothetical protein